MKTTRTIQATFIMAAILCSSLAGAANIGTSTYKAEKNKIKATYKADKSSCAVLKHNAKDVCIEEAKAKEKVAHAENEFAHTGKSGDKEKIEIAKAESAYAVAKERCDDKAGNAKDVCIEEAKAIETKALADVTLVKEIRTSKKDAAQDKRDADHKVAVEKCDALAGDAKTSCLNAAKLKAGKN